MTASYLRSSDSEAEIRSLAATSGAATNFAPDIRHKVALVVVGVGLVATVAWTGVLGWIIGKVFRLW
jgi:hypothetical protein